MSEDASTSLLAEKRDDLSLVGVDGGGDELDEVLDPSAKVRTMVSLPRVRF